MRWTDETIEITCPECEEIVSGVQAMQMHILDNHPSYSAVESAQYARKWADTAYSAMEEFEADYYDQRKLDKAIDADMDYQKYGI